MKKILILASLMLTSNALAINISCSFPETEHLKRFELEAEINGTTLVDPAIRMVEDLKHGKTETHIVLASLEGTKKVYPAGTLSDVPVTSYTFKVSDSIVKFIQVTPGINSPFNSRVVLMDSRRFVSFCQ